MVEKCDGGTARGEELVYWRRTDSSQSDGIVVVTAWIFSEPRQLEHYSGFYASCSWDSLISHPRVFNLWFPDLAKTLAVRILDELSQELEKRPRPVVFATFSGGYIACLWKIYQAKYKTIKDCFAGQLHDSSPADFVSEVGVRFVSSPSVLKTEKKVPIVTFAARAGGKILDFFFLKRFQAQDREMWTALHKSGEMGPILVLCSKDDDITPFDRIQEFCSAMADLRHKVTLVAWDKSAHVDHFRRHGDEYRDAVRSFLQGVNTSHALKEGLQTEKSSVAHVELNQTYGYINGSASTSQWFPAAWYTEANSSSDSKPRNGSLPALALSRL